MSRLQRLTAHVRTPPKITAKVKAPANITAKVKSLGQADMRVDYGSMDFVTLLKIQTGITYENTN
ncbi:hypothetical protein B0181_00280 [Moraxella caviae]|uniref:Uncharacterized protein n=1 Tax=Moraxella caviae TaxID=34060 RepID=A0A1T0ACI3_9GAMM|nr:hypothetical protein [Moraxella caviae]OOR93417.1 hypothetical protein B0181_00280 [Moraxella caviae]